MHYLNSSLLDIVPISSVDAPVDSAAARCSPGAFQFLHIASSKFMSLADAWRAIFSERWIAIGQNVKRKRDEMFFVSLSVFGFVISTII